MAKATKNQTRRAQRQQARARVAEEMKKMEETDPEVSQEPVDDSPDPEAAELETTDGGDDQEGEDNEAEVTEKDYYPQPAMNVMPGISFGPTSFEELDAKREAEEAASILRRASYDVEDLVYNIVNNPTMDASEKKKAIKSVGDGYEERVAALSKKEKEVEDIDLLVIESIQAHDRRARGPLESMLGFLGKAKLTAEQESKLDDDQFALVKEEDGHKVRKYPIHDKSHVRNALARAAQQIKGGGAGAADAKAALPKIRAAAKQMGIDVSIEKERNAIIVEKDKQGDWRWVGFASNNFKDRDGDTFSAAAHEEYVAWFEKNRDFAPVFLTWHTAGTERQNPVDFATFEKGFLILSGKLEEQEAAAILKVQKEVQLGMSVGVISMLSGKKGDRTVEWYRMYEVSDLPLDRAANPFTDLETIVKEVGMDKKAYLETILGPERAAAYLAKAEQMQAELRKSEVTEKEVKGGDKPAETKPAAPVAEVKFTIDELMKDLLPRLEKDLDLPGLSEAIALAKEDHDKVGVLEELVKSLQVSQDDRLVEMIQPKYAWQRIAKDVKPSESAETEVKPDEKIAGPGLDENWLSQATGTKPIAVEA